MLTNLKNYKKITDDEWRIIVLKPSTIRTSELLPMNYDILPENTYINI